MDRNTVAAIALVLLAILVALGVYLLIEQQEAVLNDEPVPNGETEPENGTDNEQEVSDLIVVSAPKADEKVTSPLTITGQARGNWYFEASFPVELLDGNGNVMASGIATAQGEWMTTNFVPFSSTLVFDPPATTTGTLILHKDNPSGLPEHDAELRLPVTF